MNENYGMCPLNGLCTNCQGKFCAWWDHDLNHCSMKSLAISLAEVNDKLEKCCAMWLDKS